jgi:hypothetical protein
MFLIHHSHKLCQGTRLKPAGRSADNRNEMVTWLVGAGLIAAALLLLAWAFPRLPRRRH